MKKTLAVLKTDPITHQVEKPDILLQRRDGKVLGKILYDNLNMSISGSALDEVNFDVYKMIDGKKNPLWDDIVDLKLINVIGFKRYEITVSKTDTSDMVKNVTGKSLECELSRPIYDLHINDDDYFEYQSEDNMDSNGNIIPIKYYNPTDEKHSLLHLLLADKAPDWSIGNVPAYLTITNLGKKDFIPARSFQRTFTIDGQTIYDFLVGDLAAETNTVYDFDTYNRVINIYDKFEIGEDTNTFINNRNLASSIKVEGNADSLKNCFKVIGGDDVITNYLSIVNLTGNYIWHFSDLQYNDMPEDLANAIKEYISYKDELSDEYYGGYDVFNKLIESGKEVDATLKSCGTLQNMSSLPLPSDSNLGDYYYVTSAKQYYVSNGTEWVICGAFARLCSAYDYMSYLTDTMIPSISLKSTTADAQAQLLQSNLNSTSVAVNNLSIYNANSFDGITNNVVAYAKVILDSRYQIENVKEVSNYPRYNTSSHVWTGKLKITKRTDDNDTKTFVISVNINDNELNFAKQKTMKVLANNSMVDVDNDVLAYITSEDRAKLVAYFQKYCLNSLQSFYNGYQACLSVLMSLQSSSTNSSVYDSLYNTYRIRLSAVEQVCHLRQAQVNEQQLLIYQITTEKNQLQNKADFKTYLNNINPTYWKLFNSYRREDTYQNDNYVSDGLTDGQIITKCKELLDYANYQISMACQLQRTLTIDMNNLMIMKEFESFWDKFAIFNYIRVQTDDEVLKLRLMQIDIDFNSIDQLNVGFAENISGNGNILNDVYDTIIQMNNIATSYNSTKQQVEQSQYKISQVGEWINNGLNASKVMITTSDENEVTVNNYGINLKDMSDEGNYGSFQTRLIGKGFFFTTDDWETVATALGQIYIKDSELDGHWATGLIADNIIGNLIAGQSLKITNDKGSVVIDGDTAKFTDISIHYTDAKGNYVHIGGDSSRIFAIGHEGNEQMYFDSELNKMIMRGVTIEWSTSTTPEIADINGLTQKLNGIDDYLDQLDDRIQTYSQSTDPSVDWTSTADKEKHKGDIWFDTANNLTKRWTGASWEVITDSELETLAKSKAQIFTDQPVPPYSVGDLWFNGSSDDIMTCISPRMSGAYVSSDWQKRNKYIDMFSVEEKGYQNASQVTTITENTISTTNLIAQNLHVNSANINGLITASQINTTGLIAENISADTISGKIIYGGYINGASITGTGLISTGTNGTTTINGGTFKSIGNNSMSNVIELSYNTLYTYLRPNGLAILDTTSTHQDITTVGSNGISIQHIPFDGSESYTTTINYFGVNTTNISANSISVSGSCNCNGSLNINKYFSFGDNAYTYGTSTGTTNSLVYKVSIDGVGGDNDIPSANWVKQYVAYNSPERTVKPYKDTTRISSSSGTHNFMYNLQMDQGMTGSGAYDKAFQYYYGYVSGSLSDIRLKENIRPIEDFSDKYMKLVPIQYNFFNDINCVFKGTHFGFSAQDVANIFNDDSLAIICREHQEDESANRYLNGDDAYILDKDELHALHVQMIQKQQREIESLKFQNVSLEGRIAILEQIVNQLSSQINQITN